MKKKSFFLLTLIIFLTTVMLFAQQDKHEELYIQNEGEVKGNVKTLGAIQKEINKEKNYNQALLDLCDYMKAYPERFNSAEFQVRKVFKNRTRYQTLFDQLIKISNENPEAIDECGEIITQMKQLEKNPPEEITELMDLFNQMFYYKYNASRFEKAQQQAADLAQDKQYVEAVNAITSAYDIYKVDFENDWGTNDEITSAADEVKADLEKQIAAFSEIQEKLNADTDAFTAYINEDSYEAASAMYPSIQQDYEELSRIRNAITEDAKKYEEIYKQQQEIDPEITDASYIPFMQRFITGVQNIPDSGITGAVDREWNDNLDKMKNAVSGQVSAIAKQYDFVLPEKILSEENFEQYSDKQKFVEPLSDYADLGKQINSLYTNLSDEKGGSLQGDETYDNSLDYIAGLTDISSDLIAKADGIAKEDNRQKELLEQIKGSEGDKNFDPSVYIPSLFDSVEKMSDILGEKDQLLTENQEWSSAYENKASEDDSEDAAESASNSMNWNPLTEKYDSYVDEVYDHSEKAVVEAWTGVTDSYKATADVFAEEMNEYIKYAEAYHDGFTDAISEDDYERIKDDPEKLLEYAKKQEEKEQKSKAQNKDAETEDVKKYPELTLKLTEYIQNQINDSRTILTAATTEFDNSLNKNETWKENKTVSQIAADTDKYIASKLAVIDSQEKDTAVKQASAAKDKEKADTARENGDYYLEQAEVALKDLNLDEAERLLEQATSQYADSLNYMFDQKLADRADSKHDEIAQKILNARNEIGIVNSRREYNQARTQMEQSNYEEALKHIQSAIKIWGETQAETNPEYDDLQSLINTAIHLQQGRNLTESDPLYAEMSQILSQANMYYDQGVKLYNAGNKTEGDRSFESAIENIEKIRKVYPNNEDAGVLLLKIRYFRNPELLKQNIADSLAKCKNKKLSLEERTNAYNELLNYQKYDSGNKELSNEIVNIEIELGMRPKPVDNSAKARAQRLVQDALKDEKAGRRTQALTKANQALALDRDNTQAQSLKDRLTTQRGATTTVTSRSLNARETALYNNARAAYNNRKYDEASRYMNQLLAQNKNAINIEYVANLKAAIDRNRK